MDDSKSKAVNWTDNIYNTIEGIVPDVDDIQDTIKYVENRVTSVGVSLKKFYSGVVLDFFPLSADPTTEAEAESTEPEPNSASSAEPIERQANSTEPEEEDIGLELGEAKEEEEESSLSEDHSTTTESEDEVVNIESAFYSLIINVSETSSTDGELTDEESNSNENDVTVVSTDGELTEPNSASSAEPVEHQAVSTEPEEEDIGLELGEAKEEEESSLSEDHGTTIECEDEEVNIESAFYSLIINVSETSSTDGELTDEESLCLSPFELSRLASDSTKEMNNGVVVETRDPSVESNDDSDGERMEAISLQDDDDEEKAKLEDSCVIVDDMVLYAVSRRAQKLGSYKNKLRDIFASKKRLAKEYEQLAIWYGDANIEPTPSSQDCQASHSCDSDWEIL